MPSECSSQILSKSSCVNLFPRMCNLQYFAISIFQEFNQAMQGTGFSLVRDIKSDVSFLADLLAALKMKNFKKRTS